MNIFRLIVMIIFSIAILLDYLALTLIAVFPTKNYKLSEGFGNFLLYFTLLIFPIIIGVIHILLWVA